MMRLKELRIFNEKTQSEIAKRIGVSRQVYANYENEINQPSIEMLNELANFFDCTVDYLIGRTDDLGNVTVTARSSAPSLPADEQRLLTGYRELTAPLKKMIQETLDTFLESDLNQPKRQQKRL